MTRCCFCVLLLRLEHAESKGRARTMQQLLTPCEKRGRAARVGSQAMPKMLGRPKEAEQGDHQSQFAAGEDATGS